MTTNELTIAGVLERASADWAGQEYLAFGVDRATFGGVAGSSLELAQGLYGLGVRPGKHVGILMDDCIEYAVALYAIARLGAVATPIGSRSKTTEMAHALEHSDIVALITADDGTDFVSRLAAVLPGLAGSTTGRLELAEAPKLRAVVMPWSSAPPAGYLGMADVRQASAAVDESTVRAAQEAVLPSDIGMLMYTSGTTGLPKGCLLRHDALVRNAIGLLNGSTLTSEDRIWVAGTFSHMMAITPMLACAWAGAGFVGIRYWDAGEAARSLAREHCTIAMPVRDNDWMPVIDSPDFDADSLRSCLRLICTVGLEQSMWYMQAKTPWAPIVGEFGCTEATGMMSMGAPDDPDEVRLTTGGYPFEGNVLTVIDDDGKPLPVGEVGEIVYEGPCVFAGYYKDPERTAAVLLPDGRFRPGDLARLDDAGRPTFAGTLKGMIRVGGENVSYLEVENFLTTHPAVKMASVVGVTDARYGQVPGAFVELEPGATATEDDLIDYALGRIATFKIPRYVRFVSEWPKSATKIDRATLAARLQEELTSAGITEAPRPRSRRG